MIPIHFENDDNAKLLSNDGEELIIEAHLDKVFNTKYWVDDASYGLCRRNDISITELVSLLPEISEYLKLKIEIKEDVTTYYPNKTRKVELGELPTITYRIIINDRCVFKKNTIHDSSILSLRKQVMAWIARFIYNYEIIQEGWKR